MMKCSKGAGIGKKSSLIKCLRASIRAVVRVGGLLVQSLTGNVAYGNSMGCPTLNAPTRPRTSFAVNSPLPSEHRPAENRGKIIRTSADQLHRSKSAHPLGRVAPAPRRMLRSHLSIGIIERIDEEEEEALSDCEQ